MRVLKAVPACLLVVCLSSLAQTSPQQAQIVTFDVGLSDASGRPIALTPDDLVVYENGIVRTVTSCTKDTRPLDIVLVVSARTLRLTRNDDVFFKDLRKRIGELSARDRVTVIKVDHGAADWDFSVVVGRDAVLGALTQQRWTFRTREYNYEPLYDAIALAAKRFPRDEERQHAILLVSDGLPPARTAEPEAATDAVIVARASLSMIILDRLQGGASYLLLPLPVPITSPRPVENHPVPAGIRTAVENSGGEEVRTAEFRRVMSFVLERLRNRYVASYAAPESADAYHEIRVELSGAARAKYPTATLRAPGAYLLRVPH